MVRSLDLLMQVSLILEGNGLETEAFLAPAGLMDRHQFLRPLSVLFPLSERAAMVQNWAVIPYTN